jgi:glycine dehydrogenase
MNLFEEQANEFSTRHIGPNEQEAGQMLKTIGMGSLDELIEKTIPSLIRKNKILEIPSPSN